MLDAQEFYRFLISDAVKKFLKEAEKTDPNRLRLNPPKLIRPWKEELIEQLIARKKAKTKLPNWYVLENIFFPPPLSVEQSSSNLTAQYKATLLQGQNLYDLTGGMGVDCMALSQNFKQTHYVEKESSLCQRFEINKDLLGFEHIQIHHQTTEDILNDLPPNAVLYIDPARRAQNQNRIFRFADCSPNIVMLLPLIRHKASLVLIKASPMIDLSQALQELSSAAEIHVVSVRNECKEVLFLIPKHPPMNSEIHCINLDTTQPKFIGTLSTEKTIPDQLGPVQKILLDPNVSILKAGLFKSIQPVYGLIKIAQHTHLYTTDRRVKNFPGRQFEVISEVTKKTLKQQLPQLKANVITKNYPISASALQEKLGLSNGGEYFVIGLRDHQDKTKILLTKAI
jgi:16S rRNA G966 N2-methylase RsmD|tara:strand:+ start:36306 stop:37496 length:1191 start_codon:yes stop_codon:yes gene_type:complete